MNWMMMDDEAWNPIEIAREIQDNGDHLKIGTRLLSGHATLLNHSRPHVPNMKHGLFPHNPGQMVVRVFSWGLITICKLYLR